MEIRRIKLSELRPADYNPRVELKPGDPEYEALKKSIEADGTVVPIVWNETTGNVVSGHQRLKVLADMGREETDVSVVHMTEKQEKQANVAMNRIEGEWSDEKLAELFEELDAEEIFSTGFTEEELRNIFPEEDEDPGEDEDGETDDEQGGDDDAQESGAGDAEFTVFLSFPSKAAAERWMAKEGIEGEFSAGRNLIIHMGGQSDGD